MLALVGFVGLCLLVGAADGCNHRTASASGWYLSLTRPPGTPPNWLFGLAWTGAAYVMIGVAGWLVWRRSTATAAAPPVGLAACGQRVLDAGLLRAAQPAAGARGVIWCCSVLIVLTAARLPAAATVGSLAPGALFRLDRLRDLPDRRLLVAQSDLS